MLLGERDEHQALFEKLQEEAVHISDQPEVQDQLATIQERWDHVCSASDERNHELKEVKKMLFGKPNFPGDELKIMQSMFLVKYMIVCLFSHGVIYFNRHWIHGKHIIAAQNR